MHLHTDVFSVHLDGSMGDTSMFSYNGIAGVIGARVLGLKLGVSVKLLPYIFLCIQS